MRKERTEEVQEIYLVSAETRRPINFENKGGQFVIQKYVKP